MPAAYDAVYAAVGTTLYRLDRSTGNVRWKKDAPVARDAFARSAANFKVATDQAFKEAVEQFSRKQAYLNSLARPTNIDDFSQQPAVKLVEPRVEPDWTSRNWEAEARETSAALRGFSSRANIRFWYWTHAARRWTWRGMSA